MKTAEIHIPAELELIAQLLGTTPGEIIGTFINNLCHLPGKTTDGSFGANHYMLHATRNKIDPQELVFLFQKFADLHRKHQGSASYDIARQNLINELKTNLQL